MIAVSEGIHQELIFLLISVALGEGLIILYDIFRIFRQVIPHGVIWTAIEDVCYWVVCALLVFGMVFRTNDGLVRGFSIGGILLGMLFYNHFVSPFFVKYLSLFFRKIMVILKKGLKKIVLILTRPEGYRKKPTSKAVGKLYRKMYSKYPALVRTCIRRPVMYNRTEEYIEKLEKEGNIFVLRPEMKPVSRLEKDYDKLMAFYDHGYEMMKRELPRLKAYLEK